MMDLRLIRFFFLAFCLFILSYHGYGQTCDSLQCNCEKGDMNPSGIMVGHNHPKGVFMFSYRYMNIQMKGSLVNTQSVSNDMIFQDYIMAPQTMSMDMHMFMAMYGITNKLSVMTMFNYNVNSMTMNMLPGTMQMQMNGMTMSDPNMTSMTTKSSGLGDVKVYAMYSIYNRLCHQLIISTGLSLPTGSIKLTGASSDMMYAGQRLPYMMQLGSGTYDILPGVTYLLKKDKYLWGTQVAGTYRPTNNSLGYSYGNELVLSNWLSYRALPWLSLSARAESYSIGNMYGCDPKLYVVMEPDSKPANFGGTRISGYAGLNIYLKKFAKSRISLEYGMPFYQNLNGPQMATRSMLFAGWAISLNQKN